MLCLNSAKTPPSGTLPGLMMQIGINAFGMNLIKPSRYCNPRSSRNTTMVNTTVAKESRNRAAGIFLAGNGSYGCCMAVVTSAAWFWRCVVVGD